MRIGLPEIEAAARIVRGVIAPTLQYRWPLLCECLGAAAVAAAQKERARIAGRKIAVVLSGANVDPDVFAEVLGVTETAGSPARIAVEQLDP